MIVLDQWARRRGRAPQPTPTRARRVRPDLDDETRSGTCECRRVHFNGSRKGTRTAVGLHHL